jgi:hypothetical protein
MQDEPLKNELGEQAEQFVNPEQIVHDVGHEGHFPESR